MILRVLKRYGDSGAGDWATVISWNALVSLIPIVLVMVTIVTVLLGSREFEGYLARELALVTHQTPVALIKDFDSFRDKSILLALVSILTMLWTGASLFSAMDNGLSRICGARPRSMVRQKLMAVGMIFVFILLIIPLVVSSALLSVHPEHLPPQLPGVFTSVSHRGARIAPYLIQFLFGAGVSTILCLTLYSIVPNRKQTLRRVLPGALTAGIAFELTSLLLPLYFKLTEANSAAVAISALPLLLTYFFLLGQILVFGHLVNCELGDVVASGEIPHSFARRAQTSVPVPAEPN